MLRDDAIRQGLIKPTKADIKRMKLDKAEIKEMKKLWPSTKGRDRRIKPDNN